MELFDGTNTTTPEVVVNKTLLTDLVPATMAVNLPWNTPGSATLAALDPNGALAGAQAALPIDWVQNPAAPQIGGALASVDAQGNFGVSKAAAVGATSLVYDIATVPAFAAPSGIRTILMGYRSTDSSNRSAVYTYN